MSPAQASFNRQLREQEAAVKQLLDRVESQSANRRAAEREIVALNKKMKSVLSEMETMRNALVEIRAAQLDAGLVEKPRHRLQRVGGMR